MSSNRLDRIAYELLSSQREPARRLAADEDFAMDSADLEDISDDREEIDEQNEHNVFNLEEEDEAEEAEDHGLDLEDEETEEHTDLGTIRKNRLTILSGMIWAYLGEPDAVVEEVAPNELSIKVQDLSWKVVLSEDGRINISGFDSGSEQFVGRMPKTNAENAILKISRNIQQLVSDDIDQRATPPEPPAHFGPEEPEGTEMAGEGMEGEEAPVAPQGDQGAAPPLPTAPETSPAGGVGGEEMPLDLGIAGGPAAPAPPAPGAPGAPGALPAPGAPGQFSMAPAASRGLFTDLYFPRQNGTVRASWIQVGRRRAHNRLDEVSSQLRGMGESLGKDGVEVFSSLADRVDRVLHTLEQNEF